MENQLSRTKYKCYHIITKKKPIGGSSLNKTIEYYNENSQKFITDTVDAQMTDIQKEFLNHIPENGKILDFGCGSGRDSKFFMEAGYKVTSVDGSKEMCKAAEKLTHQSVICSTFQDFFTTESFDGIWACASLLHLKKDEIKSVAQKLSKMIKKEGILYMSFKYGDSSKVRNGRFFTDLTEESFKELFKDVSTLFTWKYTITSDVRPGRQQEKWLNIYAIKK